MKISMLSGVSKRGRLCYTRSVDARCYHLAGDANWSAVNSMVAPIRRRAFWIRSELDIRLGIFLWDSPAGYGGGGPVRVFT